MKTAAEILAINAADGLDKIGHDEGRIDLLRQAAAIRIVVASGAYARTLIGRALTAAEHDQTASAIDDTVAHATAMKAPIPADAIESQSLILKRLRENGPMRMSELSRKTQVLSAPERQAAIDSLKANGLLSTETMKPTVGRPLTRIRLI